MNCSDFQAQIDFYLDEELDEVGAAQAARHVGICSPCAKEVHDYRAARSLLITAVTEQVAAVDVSGLWQQIESKLDTPPNNVLSLAAWRGRVKRAGRTLTRSGVFSTFTPLRTSALTAAAAAAVFAFSLMGVEQEKLPTTKGRGTIAQSRPVRIDSMEVAAGHSVSTWVKPRTKTRVIWLANTGSGYSVTPVSHSR